MKEKKNKKVTVFGVAILFWMLMMGLAVYAEQSDQLPEGYDAVRSALPDSVTEWLPEELASSDVSEYGAGLKKMLSLSYWTQVLQGIMGSLWGEGLSLLGVIGGLLLLSALFGAVRSSFRSEALRNTGRFCSTAALFAALVGTQYAQLGAVKLFFERLHGLMAAMIPVGGTVLAMGGNVSTATAGTASLSVFLNVAQGLCASSVIPISSLCTAMALCNVLSPDTGMRGLSGTVRKSYTFFLGLVMTLLTFLLGAQTALCAAADSASARVARLVSATVIPVVGGTVGETLRTVASSVGYLKSVLGVGGILLMVLLLLPPLLSLLLTRLAILLGSGLAQMLGCESEEKLLSELGSIWGMMIAVVAMSGVMFILAMGILMRVAVAAA